VALIWFGLAAALLLFELHHLAFYALFAAAGALGAAVVAIVSPEAYPAQVGVLIAVAALGIWLVRPYVSAVYERRHHAVHVARGVHGGLIGHEAVTLDEVAGTGSLGHVRFVGEQWLAVTRPGESIPAGSDVLIVAVEGTTLVVVPAEDGRS
jgi:membrane protein implicated in regulation of membrane protease activity